MSRRGNGLTAQAYTPLADLPPQLADAMLTVLRDARVAAYAVPTAGRSEDNLRRPPRLPADRLYVDAMAREVAEEILNTQLPALRAEYEEREETMRDEDAIWADIVASFDEVPAEGEEAPWPEEENVDEELITVRSFESFAEPTSARVVLPAEDEHYVPPPPPPLPTPDTTTRIAWVALLGGPIYLLVAKFLDWSIPGWAAFLAVAAFVGGFVALVLRMGDEPPDDTDNGAVV